MDLPALASFAAMLVFNMAAIFFTCHMTRLERAGLLERRGGFRRRRPNS